MHVYKVKWSFFQCFTWGIRSQNFQNHPQAGDYKVKRWLHSLCNIGWLFAGISQPTKNHQSGNVNCQKTSQVDYQHHIFPELVVWYFSENFWPGKCQVLISDLNIFRALFFNFFKGLFFPNYLRPKDLRIPRNYDIEFSGILSLVNPKFQCPRLRIFSSFCKLQKYRSLGFYVRMVA